MAIMQTLCHPYIHSTYRYKICMKKGGNSCKMLNVCLTFITVLGDITISDSVTFTENSDLNGASPQFSLTCISTGGPATTVTWTRDSDTVTEGTETVSDNHITAQYTHTLTVTGRLGGLYACTVSNDKPSSNSATYTIEGSCDYSVYSRCSIFLSSLQLPQLPLTWWQSRKVSLVSECLGARPLR